MSYLFSIPNEQIRDWSDLPFCHLHLPLSDLEWIVSLVNYKQELGISSLP